MVRSPCCEKNNLKKGPWTPEEDQKLVDYIKRHGHGSWRALPKLAGLNRCGKSCRLRWTNYLRPDIKRGRFSEEEERLIINLHSALGNKWSRIASHLPGRTDNEIKNFWNTHIRKKLLQMGVDPITHKPRTDLNHLVNLSQMLFSSPFGNPMMSPWDNVLRLQMDATQIAKIQLLQNLLQLVNNTSTVPNIENNSGILGLQNLAPLTGLVNEEPNVIAQAPLNPGSSPQSTNEQQVLTNSSTWFERGLNQLQGLDITNNSFNLNSSYDNLQQESKLPPLIFASSETSTTSQIEKNSNETHHLSPSSPVSTSFEAWENFIDYETSDSYWKNILDLTPPSSISNVLVDHL